MMRSARTIGLVAGGAAGGPGGMAVRSDGGQRGRFGRRQRPQLGGIYGDPIGWRGRRRRSAQEQRGVTTKSTGANETRANQYHDGGGAMCS